MKKFILTDTEIKEAVAFRRECHQYPELGYEETETTEKFVGNYRNGESPFWILV